MLAANTPAAPVYRIPFAPPPDPIDTRGTTPHAPFQIPFAPPPEDEGEAHEEGVEKKLANNDTLGQVLAREGFGPASGQVVAALAKLVDPRTIRGGQKYLVHLGDDGAPASFEYQPSAVLRYLVEKDEESGAWRARKLEAAVEIKTADAGGVVDSSLYESVQKAGESTALVSLLVEQFAWDVNFYTDTHPGDHWKVVIEKLYLGGQFYKYGRLLAAEYGGKVGTFRAFFWAGKGAPRDKPGKYYDEHGLAISKTMLKTPLRYVRISSKFDRKRFHPILHVEKAHLGIDYAAPQGTPVWASASGRVVEVGLKRGSGNTIVLAHTNGLSTRYYHLSRYARGLHVGQQVKQKEVIGFVGMTGLATGPHLHFSVTKNGAFVDPSKLNVSRDAPVPDHAAFLDGIRPRIAALKAIQPAAVARN
jgi:murein DD-endopeptidase MepM/ murein hydrolase activator NlpD